MYFVGKCVRIMTAQGEKHGKRETTNSVDGMSMVSDGKLCKLLHT